METSEILGVNLFVLIRRLNDRVKAGGGQRENPGVVQTVSGVHAGDLGAINS